MKKNVLVKGILALLVIALLTIGFSGCTLIIPPSCTTGTVYLNIDDNYPYDIWIDGMYWDTTNWNGDLTLYNVPIGNSTIYVESTDHECEGYAYPMIVCGGNNVSIDPSCW